MSTHHRILIIGTGFSGLGAAIRLRQTGVSDFAVLERAADVGGCWRDNTYPGVQCDVQSVVYSYSFAPNARWSREFARGAEIHAYLRRCAADFGVLPHIRFDTEVLDARWDPDREHWKVETSKGSYTCDALLSGHGALSEPSTPSLPGLENFLGPVFHSARWRHDLSLEGKRVAVIGTGASAIQIIPELQREVARLQVYQRSAPWVLPRRDAALGWSRQMLHTRMPWTQRLARAIRFALLESRLLGMRTGPKLARITEQIGQHWLHAQVADPSLRAKLTPKDAMGCKRVLISDEYYPALGQNNVDVITDDIREITTTGIVTADGVEHDVDVIVLCTGFKVTNHPMSHKLRGRDGTTLAERLERGDGGYLGVCAPNFPNLFMLLTGPHTGLGHNSIVYMIEAQIEYILAALAELDRRGGGSMEVTEEATARFTSEMQRKLEGTVWSSGCTSFYLDDKGRNVALWPGFAAGYKWRVRRFDSDKYRMTASGARRTPPSGARRILPNRPTIRSSSL